MPYSKVGRRRRGENPNPAQQQPIIEATKKSSFQLLLTVGGGRRLSQKKTRQILISRTKTNPWRKKKEFWRKVSWPLNTHIWEKRARVIYHHGSENWKEREGNPLWQNNYFLLGRLNGKLTKSFNLPPLKARLDRFVFSFFSFRKVANWIFFMQNRGLPSPLDQSDSEN